MPPDHLPHARFCFYNQKIHPTGVKSGQHKCLVVKISYFFGGVLVELISSSKSHRPRVQRIFDMDMSKSVGKFSVRVQKNGPKNMKNGQNG